MNKIDAHHLLSRLFGSVLEYQDRQDVKAHKSWKNYHKRVWYKFKDDPFDFILTRVFVLAIVGIMSFVIIGVAGSAYDVATAVCTQSYGVVDNIVSDTKERKDVLRVGFKENGQKYVITITRGMAQFKLGESASFLRCERKSGYVEYR